jgi:hypothetical protein
MSLHTAFCSDALEVCYTELLHQMGHIIQLQLIERQQFSNSHSSSSSSSGVHGTTTAAQQSGVYTAAVATAACQALSAAFSTAQPSVAAEHFLCTYTYSTSNSSSSSSSSSDSNSFVQCLLCLAKGSKIRTEALGLLARVACNHTAHISSDISTNNSAAVNTNVNSVHNDNSSSSTSSSVRSTLQSCFQDIDQNIRLHALKVCEPVKLTLAKLSLSITYATAPCL